MTKKNYLATIVCDPRGADGSSDEMIPKLSEIIRDSEGEVTKVENLGTKIFKAKSNRYKYNFYNKTVPFEDAELVRELPFKKNQMSLHVKTFNSLHGVGPIEDKDNLKIEYRKSISVFLLK